MSKGEGMSVGITKVISARSNNIFLGIFENDWSYSLFDGNKFNASTPAGYGKQVAETNSIVTVTVDRNLGTVSFAVDGED